MHAKCEACKGSGFKKWFMGNTVPDNQCPACAGEGYVEITVRAGEWKDSTCKLCGKALRYREHPMIPMAIPNICDSCDKKREDELAGKAKSAIVNERLKQLPFTDWMKARATPRNLAVMSALWKVVFKEKEPAKVNLLIYGASGQGKTRCCSEVAKRIIMAGGLVKWHACSIWMREWSARFHESVDSASKLIDDTVKFPGFLIIDDIGVGKRTDRTDELIYELCDRRLNTEWPTWFTSNMNPDALERWLGPDYGPRIVRRLCDACLRIDADTVMA